MFEDVATIALAGDWHGNTLWARRVVQHCADRDVRVIVHLGDFGFWPGRSGQRYLDDLDESLAAHDQLLAFVDGNHEDHLSLNAWPLSDGVHVTGHASCTFLAATAGPGTAASG